jgi:hypothetical protein
MTVRVVRLVLALAVLTVLSGVVRPADAQPPTPAAQAREHIRAGVAHAERGKWDEALREFEEAYTLEPSPLRLFNIGQARLKTGRYVAAAEAFSAVAESSGVSAEQQARARAAAASAREKIGHVRVLAPGAAPNDRVAIDGTSATLGSVVDVDPGVHLVRLQRESQIVAESSIDVGEGKDVTVTLVVRTPPPAAAPAPERPVAPAPPAPEPSRTPVLGLVLGGVAVAALATGGFFAVGGLSGYSELEDSGCIASRTCKEEAVSSVQTKVVVGDVLLGTGLVVAIAAAWILLSAPSAPRKPARAAVRF